MEDIQQGFFDRVGDPVLYVRFLAVLVLALGVIQVWQGFRDARYGRLLVAGAVSVVAAMALSDPAVVLDRL